MESHPLLGSPTSDPVNPVSMISSLEKGNISSHLSCKYELFSVSGVSCALATRRQERCATGIFAKFLCFPTNARTTQHNHRSKLMMAGSFILVCNRYGCNLLPE